MRTPDPLVLIGDQNRAVLGDAGREAFRAGRIATAALERLVRVTTPYWRPSPKAPQRGSLVIPTPIGGRRLSRRDLCRFFGLTALFGHQETATSGQTIQRFLRVFGAAYTAGGARPERITALLLELLDGQGEHAAGTAAGMLRKARGTKEDPGPAWAAVLRRRGPSPEAAHAKLFQEVRAALAATGRSEAALGCLGGKPGVAFTAEQLGVLREDLAGAFARVRPREAARVPAGPPVAPAGRHPVAAVPAPA